VINASSASKAEELLSGLRDAIGSLPVIPLTANNIPSQEMTNWLTSGTAPEGFALGEECELEAPKDEGRVIRCKKQDLNAEEFTNHIKTGMVVRKLAISWQENIECVIDHELSIKRLKFSEEVLDKVNDKNPDSAVEEFDLDFSIMTMELSAFLKALPNAFGGLQTPSE
jgi:recombination associated protein RdgC